MSAQQLDLFHLVPRDEGLSKIVWGEGALETLKLERFKRFESFEINFDQITLLVGSNGSGKTSILQAVRLFFWCIQNCLGGANTFRKAVIPFSNFDLIPAHELRELAFRGTTPNSRKLGIVVTGTLKGGLVLSFRIYASYRTLMVIDPVEAPKESLSDEQKQRICRSPLYIPGFFGVVTRELFAHDARLEELLNSGHHNEVLRNILLRLKADPARFARLVEILKTHFQVTQVGLPFNEKITAYLRAAYSEPGLRIDLDFVSGGSGFLQVLQIMAHALQNPSPILLLDEPDAHMHHSLQRSFLMVMRAFAKEEELQVIMASHSETFLRELPLDEIRVIDPASARASFFPNPLELQSKLQQAGIWPTHLELAEILRTRRVLLVEGSEDQHTLNSLGRKKFSDWDSQMRLVQTIYSQGSDTDTLQRLEFIKRILEELVNGEIRIIYLRDRDLLCDAVVEGMMGKAREKGLVLFVSELRNRETALIKPDRIEQALRAANGDRIPDEFKTEGSIAHAAQIEIQSWCTEEKDKLPTKIYDYNLKWCRSDTDEEVQKQRREQVNHFVRVCWHEPILREEIPWKLIDGKTVLRRIRTMLEGHHLCLSDDRLFDVMKEEDFDQSSRKTVEAVNTWYSR